MSIAKPLHCIKRAARTIIFLCFLWAYAGAPLNAQQPSVENAVESLKDKQLLSDKTVETLKQVQELFTIGQFQAERKKMLDTMGLHIYPLVHFKEDTALMPYLIELYLKKRVQHAEPYIDVQFNLNPTGTSWLDFMKYTFSVTLTQGSMQAVSPVLLQKTETGINNALKEVGTLGDFITKISDIFGKAFAAMGKQYADSIKAKAPVVRFYALPNTNYGFDSPSAQTHTTYETFKRADSTIRVPWKALGPKPADIAAAIQIKDTSTHLANIVFRDGSGNAIYPKNPGEQPYTFTLTGTGKNKEGEVTAYYKTTDIKGNESEMGIGQLKTLSLLPLPKRLVLVPINDATATNVQDELNRIYSQAACEWTVTIDEPFIISAALYSGEPGAGTISVETGMFKSYTRETQAIIDAYKAARKGIDKNTCYLFVTKIANDKGYDGYMPISAQFGFIFSSSPNGGGREGAIIAHELGHGAFNLKHPFEATDGRMATYDHLMAYSQSTRLYKEDWENIHDPSWSLGWFGKTEDGASITIPSHIINRLKSLKSQYGIDYLAILHCETCEKENKAQKVLQLKYSEIKSWNELKQFKDLKLPKFKLKVSGTDQFFESDKIEAIENGAKACFVLYFKSNDDYKYLTQKVLGEGILQVPAPALIIMDQNNPENKLDCTNELGNWSKVICPQADVNNLVDNVTEEYLNNLVSHLESCLQNKLDGSKNNVSRIHNYTLQKFGDEKFITDLLGGLKEVEDAVSGTRHNTKAQLFITEGIISDKTAKEIAEYPLADGEYKIWIHKSIEGTWEIKSSIPEPLLETFKKINENSETKYSFQDFIKSLQGQISSATDALDIITTGIYEGLDWLGKTVRKARIPAYVYNCNDPNYNPKYAHIYYYVSKVFSPVATAVKDYLIPQLINQVEDQAIKKCLQDLKSGNVEFAITCGLWNGIIETVGTIPDLLRLIVTPFSSKGRENFSKFIDNLQNFVKEDTQGKQICSGTWCAVKTGMGEMFDPSKCCQFGEIIGEIALPIIVSFINPEALGAAIQSAGGKTLLTIIKTLQWMDKVADPVLYASKALRFVNGSLSVIRTQTGRLLVKIENNIFKATVLLDGVIYDIAKPLNEVVEIAGADGGRYLVRYSENGVPKKALILANDLVSALKNKGVNLGKLSKLIGIVGDESDLLNRLGKTGLEFENLNKFIDDLTNNTEFLDNFKKLGISGNEIDELAKAWNLLQKEGRNGLRVKTAALKALAKVLKNNKLKQLGFTDEIFARIKASRLDEGDFATILDDLDNFGITMASKPTIEFDNFNKLIGKLIDSNPQNSQAAHWIIQDMTNHADDFIGKKWKFEATVTNSDGNAAFIDAASTEIPPMRIEYKWLTSGTVGKDDFIREFIKRDLFNTTDLSKLQWRINGQKLTKAKILEYLTSSEGKAALNNFSKKQKETLFKNFDELEGLTDKNIQDFLDTNYSKIFK